MMSILGWKVIEIYGASEAKSQTQGHKETLKQLAYVAGKLVYAILRVPEEITVQEGTLNHVENILNRVIHAIRAIQGSSSTSRVYRSLLRRKDPSISEAQLQNYVDQLYHTLFHFQAWLSLSQRVSVLEDSPCAEGKNHSILPLPLYPFLRRNPTHSFLLRLAPAVRLHTAVLLIAVC
ncbi:hypothetical protein BDP27DRAFT_1319080 [Rhodocollybia butyracea]|uniref:Uncharacterized protein n=1 Tax=Rhodocollybia butyracea TaxID=206335 RepID=A0A9P5Q231_9AGAR|nr:hypothetical protein BDP27DRAFT_1319080 [Rhodocollybia butyracea]